MFTTRPKTEVMRGVTWCVPFRGTFAATGLRLPCLSARGDGVGPLIGNNFVAVTRHADSAGLKFRAARVVSHQSHSEQAHARSRSKSAAQFCRSSPSSTSIYGDDNWVSPCPRHVTSPRCHSYICTCEQRLRCAAHQLSLLCIAC